MRSAITLGLLLFAFLHQDVLSASVNVPTDEVLPLPNAGDEVALPLHDAADGADEVVDQRDDEDDTIPSRTIDEIIQEASLAKSFDGVEDDGSVRVEMDTLFTPKQWAQVMSSEDEAGQYKAIVGDRYRWTNKIIPYRFASGHFSSSQRSTITNAMKMWESRTCLRFRPYTSSDRNYVYIVGGSGCSSYVGMIGGGQRLTLGNGCVYQSVIIHEFGHAIGLYHEQSRTDRDRYITVYTQNAHSSSRFNFNIATNSNSYGVRYDYGSVMHYGQYAFSANGKRTIVTKDPSWQSKIGTAQAMSSADVQITKNIYKC